ncbi:MAG: PepSY domain-containing protein [Edaphobacter sp.]
MPPRSLLKYTRLTHLYLGVFVAPALIFFAFTGALQTFSLHETTHGSSYKPPAWAVTLGQLHKKQTTVVPSKKLAPPEKPASNQQADKSAPDKSAPDKSQSPASPALASTPTPRPHNTLPLKIFFLIVAIGLFTSSITGLYMSYKFIRNKPLITATLIAGIIAPIVMAML